MCYNAGPLDRALRVSAGIALIVYGVATGNIIVVVVGAVPLLTGIFGFCPLYSLLKINTGCTTKA
ncbi:MAG: DUF2892 domain-containing protein [Sulfurimonas sp.]|nr:DUF2892 domain-containing protein [Sulfurimonas sp.]MDQ7060607.1 DUF2892 domain-containing protein [Sulfurimonas sp.]